MANAMALYRSSKSRTRLVLITPTLATMRTCRTDHPADGSDSEEQEHVLPLGYALTRTNERQRGRRVDTDWCLGQLKAKLAKLKRELLTPSSGGGGGGGGK